MSESQPLAVDRHRPGILARNVLYTLAGSIAPAFVAIASMPVLAASLGTERLGVLTIAWAVIGYFSLLDFGIARALTSRVASASGARASQDLPTVVITAGVMLLAIGIVGAATTACLASWLTRSVLKLPSALQPEVQSSLYVLALAVPLLTVSAGARGVLEARQRFDLVNLVRIPLGMMTYAGPLAMVPFTHSVLAGVAALLVIRFVACVALVAMCISQVPALLRAGHFSREILQGLARTGAWMTLANLASSLIIALDRLIVGGVVGVGTLAYYSSPQEVVTKLSIIPGGISTVMFPAFSAHSGTDPTRLAATFSRSVHWTAGLLFPVCAVTAVFSQELLNLWLGGRFATEGAGVAQWLCAGVLLNGLALTPFGLLQATGRSRVVALVQCLELPVYVVILWSMTGRYGVQGAAAAWAGRVAIDAAILFALGKRSVAPTPRVWALLTTVAVLALATAGGIAARGSVLARSSWLIPLLVLFAAIWWRLADPRDQAWIRQRSWGPHLPRAATMRTLRPALKMFGVTGLVRLAWRRVVRSRARCYPVIQSRISDKMGLEVGGPSAIFSRHGLLPVYPVAGRVDNCNYSNSTVWEGAIQEGRTFVFDPRHEPGRQYLLEAADLGPIEAESYDFVLSSHMLEHSANPLRSLAAFGRVLKIDGLLVLVLPHKQATFDHRRPVTTMAHLIDDYVRATTEDDMTHVAEILSSHDLTRDPGIEDAAAFRRRCLQNAENRCMHHHVFDTSLAVALVDWLGLQILDVEPTLPHHIILVCRKTSERAENALFSSAKAPFRTSSPFTLDRR